MSGSAQGRVAIEISREVVTGDFRYGYARLLTEEIRVLIERQNIDCSDINCMKWPIFGMSRHGVCKILMLQSDLMNLMAQGIAPVDPEDPPGVPDWGNEIMSVLEDGWRISFLVDSAANSTTVFNRMHLADIQPTIVTEFGTSGYGDALYIVTFKCDRWNQRSMRLSCIGGEGATGSSAARLYWTRSWNPEYFVNTYNELDHATVQEVLNWSFTEQMSYVGFLKRVEIDSYSDTGVSSVGYTSSTGLRGIDTMGQKPFLVCIDDVCARSGVVISYLPIGSPSIPGVYGFRVSDIHRGTMRMTPFLNTYKDDIIAGSVKDIVQGTGANTLTGFAAKARIPNIIAQCVRSRDPIVAVRTESVANGSPPDVFSQCLTTDESAVNGEFRSPYLDDPFGKSFPLNEYQEFHEPSWDGGEGGEAFIIADDPTTEVYFDRSDTGLEVLDNPPDTSVPGQVIASSVMERYKGKFESGVCDIWFRGWIMPNQDEAWAGGSWLELRLQTDSKGFGFPTTRIYGDINDPLLGPTTDDRQHDIEGSGLVRTWRGEDGRMRVHVGQPFGIPCLLMILSSEPVVGAFNVWKYTCLVAGRYGNDAGVGGAGLGDNYQGEIGNSTYVDEVIIAYNLIEVANDQNFASPSYKLPLEQSGFNVLPIGKDRDGNDHNVFVQAHLYMKGRGDITDVGLDDPDPVVIGYFCLTNIVDGECPVPLLEQVIDGGGF